MLRNFGVEPHLLVRKSKKDIGVLWKLLKICRHFQPDIIHSWASLSTVYGLPVARLLRRRFINGIIRNAPDKIKRFSKLWVRTKLTFPFSDVILANSKAGLMAYDAPPRKSSYIYNGFDFGRVANLEDKQEVRKRLNIETEKIVGMVGKFHFKKDNETYIKAAIQVLENRNDVTFIAIGGKGGSVRDETKLERCQALIPERHRNRIKFLGNQKSVESFVNIFDIGVLATYTEGISNSIMEYMALGKPVIATDGGGTKELISDQETGFLVERSNVNQMAQKIDCLLSDREVAKAMGKAGKKRLMEMFNLDKMTTGFVDLYKQCLNGGINK